jgi:Uma2 family endonuclease
MGATKTVLTAQEFDNYPFEEDKRYELDEGELIGMTRPTYKHNRVLTNLIYALEAFCRKTHLGEVLISENLFALSPQHPPSPLTSRLELYRHVRLQL